MVLKKIPPPLEELIEDGVIDDVVVRLLSGKEASLYVALKGDEPIAAKVYKPREQRTFKNVASYVEGRNQTRNSRDRRARQKKTSYGRELLEAGWRSMEHDALQRAFQAGVRVPEPYLLHGDVLLMELVVDDEGDPAPRLADLELDAEVARLLHLEAFQQVRRLLACGLIHGDLSAYNILVAYNGLNLIDLPQVVDASANSEAKDILHRDLKNVTEHLARFNPRLSRLRDCGAALFRHYEKGTLDEAHEPEEGGGFRPRRRPGKNDGRRHGKGPPKKGPIIERKGEEAAPVRREDRGQRRERPAGEQRKERGPRRDNTDGARREEPRAKDGAGPPKKRRRRRRRGPPRE